MTVDELDALLRDYAANIDAARGDYEAAARRSAQREYMFGTFVGCVILFVFLVIVALGAALAHHSPLDSVPFMTALACALAGGLAPWASVSWRVLAAEDVSVDPGASVFTLRALGCARPLVGAVFGLAVYFALKSGFIDIGGDSSYFYALMSFVGGFSERLVPNLLKQAADQLAPQQQENPAPTAP